MKKQLFWLVISFFLSLNSVANFNKAEVSTDSINDGPYIFNFNGTFKVKWIKNNILKEDNIVPENFPEMKNKFNLTFNYKDLTDSFLLRSNYSQSYSNVDSIGIISDIHGEYKTYINLLKAMGIIDKNLMWKFGKGQLVVLGDIFDRGDMVTEVFWHLFGLEKQAAKAGGMVHVLLGNHELLVLSKDQRYINEKYAKVETISGTRYFDLYSANSVLGKWLRSKPVVITIDSILFVHGGLSIDLVHKNLNISQINKIFSDSIVGNEMKPNEKNEVEIFLSEDYGPVWYRGYFTDTKFSESRLDSILNFYNTRHIVVGHTTFKDIRSEFNNKIVGVDAGISINQAGEMLIYKNGIFYKGLNTGKRIKLSSR